MLGDIDLHNILFLDIETVPMVPSFTNLSEKMQGLWEKKSAFFRSDEASAQDVYERAGIYAEFGKIVCISVGLITGHESNYQVRLKSYASETEFNLLEDFGNMLTRHAKNKTVYLCAHNGKEFDFPYIARRMLLNRIKLPELLDNAGKKPWEIRHLDTMELWKFGDYKHFTSLELLTTIFDIPSPKADMDGSQVAKVFYEERNISRITEYCQNDVIAVIQLILRFRGMELIPQEKIEFANTRSGNPEEVE